MDGQPENDLSYNSVTSFVNKWLNNELNDICESPITEIINVSEVVVREALRFCSLIKNDRFKVCSEKMVNIEAYIDACKNDYARCVLVNGSDCGCSSIAAYAEECFGKGQMTSWRDDKICRKWLPKYYSGLAIIRNSGTDQNIRFIEVFDLGMVRIIEGKNE